MPGAAALEKAKEQSSAFRAFLCVGDAPGLSPSGFPFGHREQGPGFLFAWENRSSVWARTWKEPRACVAGQRCKPGARLAHRRWAGLFLLIFRIFLFGFCLSNFFSFVAQAATGLYFLPKRK